MSVFWSSKKECRSFFKSLCARKFAQGLVQNQKHLDACLHAFMVSQSGLWGAYRALPEEAQVEEVFRIPHITWTFPRIRALSDAKVGELEFLVAQTATSDFVLGPYGVREPGSNTLAKNIDELHGMLIPGLVFNKNGNRLGKGKGFYDKTLADYRGIKVGICFDFQISKTPLPIEAHDVTVDYLVSESGVIDCRKYMHQE